MRELEDKLGRRWQVAVMSGSWGELSLVFSPIEGDELRIAPMQAITRHDAEDELADLTDAALRDRLNEARPWQ